MAMLLILANLPFLIAEGVSTNRLPPQLAQLKFVDYRAQDLKAGLRLARAFNKVPPPGPLPDPLPQPPDVPMSYLGSLAEKIETASALTYDEQSSLFLDLKIGLNDAETANDGSIGSIMLM